MVSPSIELMKPWLEHLSVPTGLLLLFFGVFLIRPAICILAATFGARLGYMVAQWLDFGEMGYLIAALLGGIIFFSIVAAMCDGESSAGFALGLVIALSLLPLSFGMFMWQRVVAISVLGTAFSLLMTAARREVSIVVTSYGGSFLVWHGLELIDTPLLDAQTFSSVPDFVSLNNIDMWFSVFSFLIVGFLGVAVQMILLGGQNQSAETHRYRPIR